MYGLLGSVNVAAEPSMPDVPAMVDFEGSPPPLTDVRGNGCHMGNNDEFCETMQNTEAIGMGVALVGVFVSATANPAGPAVAALGLGISLVANIGMIVGDC